MSNYGRNFELLQDPELRHRHGRFRLEDGLSVPIGVPVRVPDGADEDSKKRLPLELATGAQVPVPCLSGIAVYEYTFNAMRGRDPVTTDWSDFDTVPTAAPVQLCDGRAMKVRLINTVARVFQHQRSYTGRIMVAGLGATPTVAVGDLLTPGVGNDTAGYWAKTTDETQAWLRVTAVSANAVEAQQAF